MKEKTGLRGKQGRLLAVAGVERPQAGGQLAPHILRPEGYSSPAEALCPEYRKKPCKSISKKDKGTNFCRSKTLEQARRPNAHANGHHADEIGRLHQPSGNRS